MRDVIQLLLSIAILCQCYSVTRLLRDIDDLKRRIDGIRVERKDV